MLQNSTKHYPCTLPPYSSLPESLRPKMSKICTLRSKATILYRTIASYESHLSHLKKKKEVIEREATELEIQLWEALGKITLLHPGPGAIAAFRPSKTLHDSEPLNTTEAMIKAISSLSSDARADLLAELIQSQKADLAKESATQEDGNWEGLI